MKKLIELRKKQGLRQEDIARKLNITRGAVTSWELGRTSPRVKILPELAKILKCKVDDFF